MAAVEAHPFEKQYRTQVKRKTPPTIKNIENYQFIFIAGFLNEGLDSYFEENIEALLNAGVDGRDILLVLPNSNETIAMGSQRLISVLNNQFHENTKKPVIVAHSKGAAEILALVLKKPEWLQKFHKVFMIQAAFGTPVADFASGKGHPITDDMPLFDRLNCSAWKVAKKILDPWVYKGVQSLTTQWATSYFKKLLDNTRAKSADLSKKIFYVTSTESSENASPILSCSSLYLDLYYSESDGLVPLENQMINGTGTHVLHLQADHLDLVFSRPLSASHKEVRRGIMWSILESI